MRIGNITTAALVNEFASINNLSSRVNDPRTAFTHNCRA